MTDRNLWCRFISTPYRSYAYIINYRRSARVIHDCKALWNCDGMLSSHKYLQLTSVCAIVLTLSHCFSLSLSFFFSRSLSFSLPCQLSWRVAIFDLSTNQRQISPRVRIIFTFGIGNIPLDFYRSSVIVIGYWPLDMASIIKVFPFWNMFS